MKKVLPIFMLLILTGCIDYGFKAADFLVDKSSMQNWRHLAKKGDVKAQYKMGQHYCCGTRPRYDNVKALKWWCTAAKGGSRDAMFEVAGMYQRANEFEGDIIPKDNILAAAYYILADQTGHGEAGKERDKLMSGFSTTAARKAWALAKIWPDIPCGTPKRYEVNANPKKKNLFNFAKGANQEPVEPYAHLEKDYQPEIVAEEAEAEEEVVVEEKMPKEDIVEKESN